MPFTPQKRSLTYEGAEAADTPCVTPPLAKIRQTQSDVIPPHVPCAKNEDIFGVARIIFYITWFYR